MKALMITTAAVTFAALATAATAQDHAAHATHANPAVQAFEHYEGVRAALSADNLAGVEPHARPLAASVEATGGPDAKKAAEALAAATTIEDARKHFGALSVILVPKFQEAGIKGASAYYCSMAKLPWMQRADTVENPYYGKSMLTCGEPLPAKQQ
jgi:hypothetical protein